MKKFQVNDYITLKLENGKTIIYVSGERFRQCKYLLLNIPLKTIDLYDNIKSIDEAAKKLDHSLEDLRTKDIKISPETEFWAHCSNLQAWAENNYNSDLLHSNLVLPLLKKLIDKGDRRARQIFVEQISKMIINGNNNVIEFVLEEEWLNYFEKEHLLFILENIKETCFTARILYLELRFSILKKLSDFGNQSLKKLFKNEVLKVLKEGDITIIQMLYLNNYIYYLSREEFWNIYGENGKVMYEIERCLKKYKIVNDHKKYMKLIEKYEYFRPVSHIYIDCGPAVFTFQDNKITGIGIFGDEAELFK